MAMKKIFHNQVLIADLQAHNAHVDGCSHGRFLFYNVSDITQCGARLRFWTQQRVAILNIFLHHYNQIQTETLIQRILLFLLLLMQPWSRFSFVLMAWLLWRFPYLGRDDVFPLLRRSQPRRACAVIGFLLSSSLTNTAFAQ